MKIGIAGASGFTGKKLVEILDKHEAGIEKVFSDSLAGKKVNPEWPEQDGIDLQFEKFSVAEANKLDLVFLATPNEFSALVAPKIKTKIIDLSQVHRMKDGWVYGLPEVNKSLIQDAERIANPGCYATASILSALPLKDSNLHSIIFDCVSGISGAGKKNLQENNFNYLSENFFAYKLADHAHNKEIKHFFGKNAFFTPHVAPLKQGLMCTTHVVFDEIPDVQGITELYKEFYSGSKFVKIVDFIPDLEKVRNTNKCFIGGFGCDSTQIVIVSVIDNLVKGASGQAIQNMNLMLGFDEKEGLS